jgi:CubicO group peptidase (beta-lactamase class C family)
VDQDPRGAGSVAFVFIASLSILKLAKEGKLSLRDPVHKLAPEVWFQNRWEATDPVRVVDLLEHTTAVTSAPLIAAAYLAWWGVIGIRTWI